MQEIIAFLFSEHKISEEILNDRWKKYWTKNIEELHEKEFIRKTANMFTVNSKIRPENIFLLLNYFIRHPCHPQTFVKFFDSILFQKSINTELIYHISKIQEALVFDSTTTRKIIKLLKMSPSALIYSNMPDPMIVTHRKKDKANALTNNFDNEYFMRMIYTKFQEDFNNPAMKEMFFHNKKIIEVETVTKIRIKSKRKTEIQSNIKTRHGLGETDEKLGNQVIQILVINSAPEPWENYTRNAMKA
jgi:hypothetical protein